MSSVNTMKTWPIPISSMEELQDEYIEEFKRYFEIEGNFPYTIFIPMERGITKKSNEKIICIDDKKICTFENKRGKITVTSYKLNNTNYVETGTILLISWIKISGLIDNELVTCTFEFNSVGKDLMKPIINMIRFRKLEVDNCSDENELMKLENLKNDSYKFYNYSKEVIAEGESIIESLYQPDTKKKNLTVIKRSKVTCQNIIMTNNEMIIIKEQDKKASKITESMRKLSIVSIFIALKKISNIYLTKFDDKNLYKCTIVTSLNAGLELVIIPENVDEIEKIIYQLKNRG